MRWIVALATLNACASASLVPPPPVRNPAQVAEVTVLRNRNLQGRQVQAGVMFDGWRVAILETGQYVTFPTDPGTHSIGVGGSSIAAPMEVGGRYYFLVSISSSGASFELERITEERARESMESYRKVELGFE